MTSLTTDFSTDRVEIGRNAEIKNLQKRIHAATEGNGSLVVLTGPPGIGKSNLVTRILRLRPRDLATASGTCLEHARSPLAPISDALEDLDSRLNVLHGASRLPRAENNRDLYRSIAERFRACSQRLPCVIAIEDIHWADAETLSFLTFIASKLGSLRVLMLATSRPPELLEEDASKAISSIERSPFVSTLRLVPLPERDMIELVLSQTGASELDHATRRAIRVRSEGNPLFAKELTRQALLTPGRLPQSLKAVVIDRASLLSDSERSILEYGAVLGREFSETQLESIVADTPLAVRTALKNARSQSILADDRSNGHWQFRHALLQEYLLDALPATELRRRHAHVAMRLENSADVDGLISELAFHWTLAGDIERASMYQEAAGDKAMCEGASVQAADYYRRVADLRAGTRDAGRLREKLGKALEVGGFPAASTVELESALFAAKERLDAEGVARIAILLSRTAAQFDSCSAGIRYLEGALESLADSPSERSRIEVVMAFLLATIADSSNAKLLVSALESRTNALELSSVLELHEAKGIISAFDGDVEASIGAFAEGARRAQEMPRSAWAARINSNGADYACATGRTEIGLRAASAALAELRPESESLQPFIYAMSARCQMRAGNTSVALTMLRQAEGFAFEIELPRLDYILAVNAFTLAARTGQHELTEPYNSRDLLQAAFGSREPIWTCDVVAAIGEWLSATDQTLDLTQLIGRACEEVRTPVLSYEFALLVLRLGSERHRSWLRSHLEPWAPDSTDPFIVAIKDAACGRYRQAANNLSGLKVPFAEAVTFELAGDEEQALSAYRRAGAHAHTKRLDSRSGSIVTDRLTKRERDVSNLLLRGSTNKAIASELSLSERTVEVHLRSIYAKSGVAGRLEYAALRIGKTGQTFT